MQITIRPALPAMVFFFIAFYSIRLQTFCIFKNRPDGIVCFFSYFVSSINSGVLFVAVKYATVLHDIDINELYGISKAFSSFYDG